MSVNPLACEYFPKNSLFLRHHKICHLKQSQRTVIILLITYLLPLGYLDFFILHARSPGLIGLNKPEQKQKKIFLSKLL